MQGRLDKVGLPTRCAKRNALTPLRLEQPLELHNLKTYFLMHVVILGSRVCGVFGGLLLPNAGALQCLIVSSGLGCILLMHEYLGLRSERR